MRQFLVIIAMAMLSNIFPFLSIAETNKLPYYTLLDTNTGHVIAENYPDHPWNPASLTKLMTAYVVFSFLKEKKAMLTTPITISKNASEYPPSNSTFKKGSTMTLDNALKLLIVKSANDIAVAIAESLCKTEKKFVQHMNNTSKNLGLSATHFMNAHGVVQHGHYTTARDMAILSWRIKTDFPQYMHYFQIKGLEIKGKKYPNTNWAVGTFLGADGMKTGFTCASGFNIVASAIQGDQSLIAVILGALDRNTRNKVSASLLSMGFYNKTDRKKINYIIKDFYQQNLSNEVPNISEEVCTTQKEIINYNTQMKEAKDKESHFIDFEKITLLKNKITKK
ncbi:D-alanyl-D-alanine carboxypeptidase family protein [Candidatus Liberibacter asiaticus]|uniref:Peptidase S11, D-alanyl-D-alanine carboxypeptidase 1 n=2 Tax=Liberibacter asiaticus TaxID=34021 RepID=C6XEV6_LIBAP|nr:D-alanyl-D-alanine carboxypeptidase family protein [Candidatus Liberibacter asiaticus]ACT56908.1 peptidase S11, D-alanyl-D-alanine carboxypeptidase 1 [Candidatus Liberibacter asiaticus str. psy62]AGH16672.1 peptidase S11, D-alanyl-D-alanine carboxypeptidase 1 [Candidatus Liberibacter asiaticus str. gxpsy]ALK07054.1 D-alanyl-D-alanine carboxypeptidase [Candidatus Liberibacter asiaticus]ASK52526.1 peptidase S11 [Candidatus Liberibacter asiaticus]AWL13850.1 D-alanyl-D-alanine carboxypeptidase 